MPQTDDVQKAISDIAGEVRAVHAEQDGLVKSLEGKLNEGIHGLGSEFAAERTVVVQRLEAVMRHLQGIIPRI